MEQLDVETKNWMIEKHYATAIERAAEASGMTQSDVINAILRHVTFSSDSTFEVGGKPLREFAP
jgi:hypothetical protein